MNNITTKKEIDGIMCDGIQFEDGTFLVFAKERIKILTSKNIAYSVSYEETELSDNRWKVKATLTMYNGPIPLVYENYAIRSGDFGLETAATIAFSRAIATSGIGSKYGIGTAEGYAESLALKPKNDIKKAITERLEKNDKKIDEEVKKEVVKNITPKKPTPKPKEKLEAKTPHSNEAAINYLNEVGVEYKMFAKENNAELRTLVSHHKKGNLIDFVHKTYGKEATVYCGDNIKYKETLRTSLPTDNSFKPKQKVIFPSDDVIPRVGIKLANLVRKFKKVTDEDLLNKLLNEAGIEEYKSVKDFLANAEQELIDTIMLEYGIK